MTPEELADIDPEELRLYLNHVYISKEDLRIIKMKNYCVLTTINPPTKAVEKLYERFGSNLIVVGDLKTPADWKYKDATYIPVTTNKSWFESYDPYNHYARKNIGYLEAIKNKADLIYESDDDNVPNEFWAVRTEKVDAKESVGEGWFNVYKILSDENIWPRGFSLKHLHTKDRLGDWTDNKSSIQQGLADKQSDVDALYRITTNSKEHFFYHIQSAFLIENSWCPFNSQSTWWFPKAYPLMYLPVYASFRMTDIWRSFVAQRCLWEINDGVTFHSPSEVFQDRNEHDLLKDFEDEIPGYLKNDLIVETFSGLKLKSGEENICENMLTCYQSIVDKEILPEMEIRSLKSWIKEYNSIS